MQQELGVVRGICPECPCLVFVPQPLELAGTPAAHSGSQSEGAGPGILQGPDVFYQVQSQTMECVEGLTD